MPKKKKKKKKTNKPKKKKTPEKEKKKKKKEKKPAEKRKWGGGGCHTVRTHVNCLGREKWRKIVFAHEMGKREKKLFGGNDPTIRNKKE